MYPSYREFYKVATSDHPDEANRAARQVVIDYNNSLDPNFLVSLCESAERRGSRIHHQLWSGIVFPYVASQLTNNPVAVKCLIQTIQNLYSDKSAHAKLGWATEWQLVDLYRTMCPSDQWALNRKKAILSRWLAYTIHEWPSGVLYGNDGASLEQCEEILEAVRELRSLDSESAFASLCSDVEEKINAYRKGWLDTKKWNVIDLSWIETGIG
jgi:hypothetical protein